MTTDEALRVLAGFERRLATLEEESGRTRDLAALVGIRLGDLRHDVGELISLGSALPPLQDTQDPEEAGAVLTIGTRQRGGRAV
jgi:hypothetical protein